MGEIFSDFFLFFFVLIKNGAEVVERAVSMCHVGVGVHACVRARLRELLRAGGWQLRRRRRRLRRAAGPGVSVPSWPGRWWRGLWLWPLAPWRLPPARAAAGCSWGRRARARDFFFVFSSRAEAEGNGIFADGGVESSPGLARAGSLVAYATPVGRHGRPGRTLLTWQASTMWKFLFPRFSFPKKNKG